MKTILPFFVRYSPIEKLALINFEKKPDEIYCGLELQYINGGKPGTGYRILAYRNDNYVDMYDDTALTFDPDEKCDVAGNGLLNHIQTNIEGIRFQKIGCKVLIDFEFNDILGRRIQVHIHEKTERRSTPMNLLAPIGSGTVKPSCLPAFFLYDFDFVRKNKTKIDITIDKKKIKLDNFPYPVPMNGQFRYYTRYSLNSLIFEFLPTDIKAAEVELDENLQYISNDVCYQFQASDDNIALASIDTLFERKMHIEFSPAISLAGGEGNFSIIPDKSMGEISGIYSVNRICDTSELKIIPTNGWRSVPNSFITKKIMSPDSLFCSWCKKYEYTCKINLNDLSSSAEWHNGNITPSASQAGR